MTRNPYMAGLAAGGVSAVLYLSLATGSFIGVLLFFLAPLPGFIIGFGWGTRAATVTALVGVLLVLIVLGVAPAAAYCFSLALPSVLVTHYAFLYRIPVTKENADEAPKAFASEQPVEWYPIGHIVLLTCYYGAFLAMLSTLIMGPSLEAYQAKIATQIDLAFAGTENSGMFKQLKPEQWEQFKKLVQNILPASTAVLWSLFALINMWIAAHIIRLSGMMQRPWPVFFNMQYPPQTSLLFAGVFVSSLMIPAMPGLLLSALAGALMVAFLLLGLAVIHQVSHLWPARSLVLFGTYVAVIFIGWGALLLILLGGIEPFVNIRQRMKPPPS